MSPYEVLGVSPDVDQGALRDAYRRLVRLHHPDVAPNQALREQSHQQMQLINQAWQIIGDPQKRATYDARVVEAKVTEAKAPDNQINSSGREKASLGRAGRSNLDKTSSVPISPTRRRLKQIKQMRSPEEIRVRNQQKLLEAGQFLKAGRTAEAIAACQSVLRNDFRSVVAREILGDIYFNSGDLEKALVLFEQALSLQRGNINLRRKIAMVQARSAKNEPLKNVPSKNDATSQVAPSPPKPEATLKSEDELLNKSPQAAPTPKPASAELVHDGLIHDKNFWRRLSRKLGRHRKKLSK